MEYKELAEYPNTYPSINSYKNTNTPGSVVLNGVYPERNSKEFKFEFLDNLQIIPETTFKFILVVKDSKADLEPKYYTSDTFYNFIEISLIDKNPYFLQQALNESLFLTVELDKQIELFNSLKFLDIAVGVKQYKNIFIGLGNVVNDGNIIDYESLVRYIDWVVSPNNPLDFDTGGVLPTSKVANYEIGEWDPDTGDFISKAELSIRNKLEDLYDELDAINDTLNQIAGEISEPKLNKPTLLDGIMLGLSVVAVAGGAASGLKQLKAASEVTKGLSKARQAEETLRKSITPLKAKAITLTKSNFGDITKKVVGVGFKGQPAASLISAGGAVVNTTSGIAAGAAKVAKGAGEVAKGAGKVVKGATNTLAKVSDLASSSIVNVVKGLVKPIAPAVVKAISKQAITRAFTFITGPVGIIATGLVGIAKFFIGQAEEKKRYEASKKEYALTINQMERLHQRKADIESEIDGIISGKITLDVPKLEDSRLTATQKYLQNYGKKLVDRIVISNG
jgi:hypothetical protein